jgi:hypothetical protein
MAGNEELDLLEFFPVGRNRHDKAKAFFVQDDGTLRGWNIGVGVAANGAEQPLLAEAGRQGATVLWGEGPAGLRRLALQDVGGGANDPLPLINVPTGWDGAAFPIFALENAASGEPGAQKTSQYGTNDGGDVVANLSDSARVPFRRIHHDYEQVDPVVLTAAVLPLYTPGGTGAELYSIEFLIVNNDSTAPREATSVTVGVDIGAAGTLGLGEYWLFDHIIPFPGDTDWRGPFLMPGDDRVMGIADRADTTSVHWRIKRVDLVA